ncbi:translation initiation factor IF-2 [Candidatus Kaiserbacteria bacterium CG10_big_fil_rev_8_21_14_0_10_59_10]|uniref:Translation initiation factor IF-2 n=1 Tax=Candidatus Kaiserbacteria bacterium CG10_big_fil_rev_8_21_14_0_10_59_10 TaxID=1974612 RepID=A0A2H0U6S7_9BACT|nr:MAG: translation initiation factor IF-2 [Candidatus Kaiserbacteria bacterium CG10_big_fil_rev_8_21_14_0_10_59_10]
MHANQHIVERPPVVVVMGHVDHGKSTLLDFIRKSNTVDKEAGGITQHVAAYEVVHTPADGSSPKRITFIDTPGHAAFQTLRARGANVADVAILVVAADDGVKAQTLEALESIKRSGIPFVVAINKIDKPNASVERTQASLLESGVYLEKMGGDVPWAAISAKSGAGIPELLDLVLLVAEMQGLTGDTAKHAEGYVMEAHRDQRRGIAATLIITDGTLSSGMAVRAGGAVAPVRLMEDHTGAPLKKASFSTPVLLVGFDVLPEAGLPFSSYKTKREADEARKADEAAHHAGTASLAEGDEEGRFLLPVIVRADTAGSLEAVTHEAARLGDEHAGVRIYHQGIGVISEADIKAAIASKEPAVVVGFNVGVDALAREHARQHGVSIETFDIIYKLSERLEELMRERSPKRTVEEKLGRAKILKVFSKRRQTYLLGGSVLDGRLEARASVRALRKGETLGTGTIRSIQANRQNVERIEEGREFGAEIECETEAGLHQGDILECYKTRVV